MIKQIVKSEEDLELLIEECLKSDESNNQHGDNSAKEVEEVIESFLETYDIDEYPCFVFADFTFIYIGMDIKLSSSALILTKNEMLDFIDVF